MITGRDADGVFLLVDIPKKTVKTSEALMRYLAVPLHALHVQPGDPGHDEDGHLARVHAVVQSREKDGQSGCTRRGASTAPPPRRASRTGTHRRPQHVPARLPGPLGQRGSVWASGPPRPGGHVCSALRCRGPERPAIARSVQPRHPYKLCVWGRVLCVGRVGIIGLLGCGRFAHCFEILKQAKLVNWPKSQTDPPKSQRLTPKSSTDPKILNWPKILNSPQNPKVAKILNLPKSQTDQNPKLTPKS